MKANERDERLAPPDRRGETVMRTATARSLGDSVRAYVGVGIYG